MVDMLSKQYAALIGLINFGYIINKILSACRTRTKL